MCPPGSRGTLGPERRCHDDSDARHGDADDSRPGRAHRGRPGGAVPRPIPQRDELQARRHRRRNASVGRIRRPAAVRADRPARGEDPAHPPKPARPRRAVPRERQAAQRAARGAGEGADCHPGTACSTCSSSATRSRTASSCSSTGSGAVSAAGPASPTAPRWRSRSTRRNGHDREDVDRRLRSVARMGVLPGARKLIVETYVKPRAGRRTITIVRVVRSLSLCDPEQRRHVGDRSDDRGRLDA